MQPIPILFLGDSPNLHTGLARIGRDLASLVAGLPQFRVGYLGRGGVGSFQLPFPNLNFPESAQWGERYIESTWRDFAGEQKGIIFSIWDPSRLHWFANPVGIDGALGEFLRSGRFQRWGYFPIDSYGVGKRLTTMSCQTLAGYNRTLAYGIFGAEVVLQSTGNEVEWIPHGMNLDVFTPRDRVAARMALGARADDLVVGCVMTNQARKDWGLAFATIAKLRETHPNLIFWAHVDTLLRSWDIQALAADFDLQNRTIVTQSSVLSDTELSYYYSACDVTMLPSLGEGFGYPVVESLACGVPCITGSYGGAAELIPNTVWLVDPVAERLDTPHNCLRPVYRPIDFAVEIENVLCHGHDPAMCRSSVEHLDWKLLWPSRWKKWFLDGLA
jgi:glycosyltransferase involved in cell wall biosynthesis